MIGKKVMNAKGGGSKAARIGSLVDYIRAPQRANSDEKCAHYGGRGFVTESPGGHRAEMVALAQDAVRSADPVNHYILSWREGEVPLPVQVEQAIDLFLDELGLQGHQVVYGLHSDTDNLHLHIAVSRVHPETLRVMKIHRGFDLEALHRAVARIEHAQGWLPEHRARYHVNEAGRVVRSTREQPELRRPTQDKCDREAQSGCQSAERIAIEQAAPIIAAAHNWEDLHAALAAQGMRYERAGSGAKVFVGGVAVKASRVAREASFSQLARRLGPYQPTTMGLQIASNEARPLRPDLPGWRQYMRERAKYYADKGTAWGELRVRLSAECRASVDSQLKRREEVLSGSFRHRGHLLNSLRAALAEEQRSERMALRQAHGLARERVRAQYGRFPNLEQWLREQGQDALAEQWRYRHCAAQMPERPASVPELARSSMYVRYIKDWGTQQEARREALDHVWAQYGRDVAQLKSASKQRWAAVKVFAKGPVAGKLWALSARIADQSAWRRLHERHRQALGAADRVHRPLEWSDWLRAVAGDGKQRALAMEQGGASRALRRDNAVVRAGGTQAAPASSPLLHPVPGGTIEDNGERMTLSGTSKSDAFAALLRLARSRYGARLDADGDDVFRERLAQAAADSKLDVTFADPQLEARRQQLQRHDVPTRRRRRSR